MSTPPVCVGDSVVAGVVHQVELWRGANPPYLIEQLVDMYAEITGYAP